MQTKFKRHSFATLKRVPDPEYLEYNLENLDDGEEKPVIEKGMKAKINLILPNGQYHVEIFDEKGNVIAYAAMNEEDLETAK